MSRHYCIYNCLEFLGSKDSRERLVELEEGTPFAAHLSKSIKVNLTFAGAGGIGLKLGEIQDRHVQILAKKQGRFYFLMAVLLSMELAA